MLAYPSMLVPAAKAANMKVPHNPDRYKAENYPHFDVFCKLQLCRRMQPTEHWENAKVIAAVPDDKIRTMTLGDFVDAGLIYSD